MVHCLRSPWPFQHATVLASHSPIIIKIALFPLPLCFSPAAFSILDIANAAQHCDPVVAMGMTHSGHKLQLNFGPKWLNCIWLVVSPILTNMKVNGKDYPIYYGK
jgi:hypothetical protein